MSDSSTRFREKCLLLIESILESVEKIRVDAIGSKPLDEGVRIAECFHDRGQVGSVEPCRRKMSMSMSKAATLPSSRDLITYEAHVRTCALARDPIQAVSMASCNSFSQCWATVTRSRRRKTLG